MERNEQWVCWWGGCLPQPQFPQGRLLWWIPTMTHRAKTAKNPSDSWAGPISALLWAIINVRGNTVYFHLLVFVHTNEKIANIWRCFSSTNSPCDITQGVGELCRISIKMWGRALHNLGSSVRPSSKSREMSPPSGHFCTVFLQQEITGISVIINTITYFDFCSGAVREGGGQDLMSPVVLYFDLKGRFDTVKFQT